VRDKLGDDKETDNDGETAVGGEGGEGGMVLGGNRSKNTKPGNNSKTPYWNHQKGPPPPLIAAFASGDVDWTTFRAKQTLFRDSTSIEHTTQKAKDKKKRVEERLSNVDTTIDIHCSMDSFEKSAYS
jgi:hypothetical protein